MITESTLYCYYYFVKLQEKTLMWIRLNVSYLEWQNGHKTQKYSMLTCGHNCDVHIRYLISFKNLDLKSVSHVEMTDETLLCCCLLDRSSFGSVLTVITDSNTHMNYTVDWKLNTWLSQTRPESTRPDQTPIRRMYTWDQVP